MYILLDVDWEVALARKARQDGRYSPLHNKSPDFFYHVQQYYRERWRRFANNPDCDYVVGGRQSLTGHGAITNQEFSFVAMSNFRRRKHADPSIQGGQA